MQLRYPERQKSLEHTLLKGIMLRVEFTMSQKPSNFSPVVLYSTSLKGL